MSNWNETTLNDVCSVLGDGLHGTPQYSEDGEYAFVNGNNLVNGKIVIKKDTKKVDRSQYEKYKKPLTTKTILVSINGTLGNVAIYSGEKIILGKSACYFNVKEEYDADYIRYVVSTPVFKSYLENNATGTTIKNVSLKQMREYRFLIPELETQRKIARVLKLIDDKIENNNRINRNLQEQCDAIYKSYFVTNADETWKIGSLADFITVKYGKDHKKMEDGTIPCYGSGGVMRYVEKALYDQESVLIPRKGSLNNVMYVNEPFWSVDTMFFTMMKAPNVAKFVYHFVKEKDLVAMNTGSAVPSMTADVLYAMELQIPPVELLVKFENEVSPLYISIQNNNVESKKLAELRDSLLPRLMSGELDVSDIEI